MTDGIDVQDSLAEMDRKLRELQDELALAGEPLRQARATHEPPLSGAREAERVASILTREPPPPPEPEPPAAPEPPTTAEHGEGEELDGLRRAGEDLRRAADAVLERYERAIASVEAAVESAVSPARDQPAALVLIDAGPFADISELSAFELALEGVAGTGGVVVRGFEGDRAMLEVRLSHASELLRDLRRSLPAGVAGAAVREARLTLDLGARG